MRGVRGFSGSVRGGRGLGGRARGRVRSEGSQGVQWKC